MALMSGLIIFPSCFAYNVQPDSGPSLIFITLPNVFNAMAGGRLWGTLFFLFMTFASLSTVIAVFENIISFTMDLKGWDRKKAVLINLVGVLVLSMPCVLGYNVWSGITPLELEVRSWIWRTLLSATICCHLEVLSTCCSVRRSLDGDMRISSKRRIPEKV